MIITRPIDKIIIHSSATQAKMDIGVEEIRKWHLKRGFRDIGYHYVIRRSGRVENGRNPNQVGAHTKGYNTGSLGICLVGGANAKMQGEDNFTPEQWRSLRNFIRILKADLKKATIHGHKEFNNTECPSFDVQKELKDGRLKGL